MGLLRFTVSAVLGKYHIEISRTHEYLVGSLIMAKAVLLIDAFADREWLQGRPLIYPTLWNTGLYFVGSSAEVQACDREPKDPLLPPPSRRLQTPLLT
jgi:hypothetical protein